MICKMDDYGGSGQGQQGKQDCANVLGRLAGAKLG